MQIACCKCCNSSTDSAMGCSAGFMISVVMDHWPSGSIAGSHTCHCSSCPGFFSIGWGGWTVYTSGAASVAKEQNPCDLGITLFQVETPSGIHILLG